MAEEIYETLQLMLCTVDETQLRAFCEFLGINKDKIAALSKRNVLREVLAFIDEALDKSSEEQSVDNLTTWLHFWRRGAHEENTDAEVDDGIQTGTVEEMRTDTGEQDSPESGPTDSRPQDPGPQISIDMQIEGMRKQYEFLLENQRKEMEVALERMRETRQGQTGGEAKYFENEGNQNKLSNIVDPNNVSSLLRRELKIYGQIGEQGKNDQLSFVSLSRQIDTAVEKGYTQKEVVEAVIKAMRPGLQLRSYIETLQDLTLSRLRQILRSHYKEKSGTQLYQELATICQGPKESPDAFLLRALDLRQKVLFASKEADASLKYDPELVQGMFLRSVETGLRDDNILTKFRQVLHVKEISDEDLIQQMGNISSAEAERQARLGKRVKDVQASSVVSDDTKEKQKESMEQKKKAEKSSESRILETMEAMQAQIQSLQEEVKSQKSETASKTTPGYYKGANYYRGRQNNPPRNGQEPSRACSECNEKGLSQSCIHCYYCGGENHFARDCLKRQRDQGNGRGLRRGDKV